MLGYAFEDWEVFQVDGCTIGENPLSMDGIFPGWMAVLAMDSGFSEKLVYRQSASKGAELSVVPCSSGGRWSERDDLNGRRGHVGIENQDIWTRGPRTFGTTRSGHPDPHAWFHRKLDVLSGKLRFKGWEVKILLTPG